MVIIATEVARIFCYQMIYTEVWNQIYWQILEGFFLLCTSVCQLISIIMLITSIRKMQKMAKATGDLNRLQTIRLNLAVGVICLISFLLWYGSFDIILVLYQTGVINEDTALAWGYFF